MFYPVADFFVSGRRIHFSGSGIYVKVEVKIGPKSRGAVEVVFFEERDEDINEGILVRVGLEGAGDFKAVSFVGAGL